MIQISNLLSTSINDSLNKSMCGSAKVHRSWLNYKCTRTLIPGLFPYKLCNSTTQDLISHVAGSNQMCHSDGKMPTLF